ncbi:hypothetical protein PR048_000519 [Dryococelus australis]|uniref:Uncharacterized protein n=1 Tax=Dryococelus australis TaxID=614101 RepID=A0ABQ9IG40_9NEOP|nr:hypothetical protein PR048_000519 [Dryococelus australis]
MKRRGKREIPEKTRRPTTSSCTIPTCDNPVTRPGKEPVCNQCRKHPRIRLQTREITDNVRVTLCGGRVGMDEEVMTINLFKGKCSVESELKNGATLECKGGESHENRRQAASSSTITTRENPGVNPPGIEPGSPCWEASALATAPPLPLTLI